MSADARHLMHQPVYGIMDPDYARFYTKARCVAWSFGYGLAIHGSFTRDLDVIAIPWGPHVCTPAQLASQLCYRTGLLLRDKTPVVREHGRLAWTFFFPDPADPRWIDFSVMPPPPRAKTEACLVPEKSSAKPPGEP